ncbi:kelch-like protein 20 [Episyrphus balteatus]|uniref:kelch-like protein 20 n=1 Tax=Episyrphus balteatus TaxID=286459 RepID=UPI002485C390|nr:kelch-like protein 20 [Episyrphus balteatus]
MENLRNKARNNNSVLFNNNNKKIVSIDLMDGLNRLREQGTFCDIKLKAGEEVILAHKSVLCACSPYFNVLFSGSFKESGQTEFVVKDVPPDCLKILIDYLYTGLLKFDSSNVERVILAASYLQIISAEEVCSSFLANNLVLSNCISYIIFAGKHSIRTLRLKALEVAVANFHNIYSNDEYLEIDFDEFRLFVQKLKLSGCVEDLIYLFVMRWIHHLYDIRIEFLQDLLKYLQPLVISREILLSNRISSRPIHYLDHWAAPATSVNLNESQIQILLTRRITDFTPRTIKFFTQNDQYEIQSLPEKIFEGSYVCFGYNIFHLGGWKNKKLITDETFTIQQKTHYWNPFVPLLKGRAYHRSGVLDGTIYTIGGSDGLKALPQVEFLDLHTGRRGWCEDLPRPKEQMGLAFHENSIYTIGGKNRAVNLKCIQRLDPRIGKWEEIESNSYRAGASSCAVVDDYIYTTHSDALQRYDVRTNRWTLIRTQYNRYPDQVFTVDNKLYGLFKDHIGLYVPESGRWSVYRQLNYHHNYLNVSTNLRYPLTTRNDFNNMMDELVADIQNEGGILENDNNNDDDDDDDDDEDEDDDHQYADPF